MDAVNIASIVVAIIAAAGAWASQRAASKASLTNTVAGGRLDMEKDAYDRARAFDTETIIRQNKEIEELRKDHDACFTKIRAQEDEIRLLRMRIAKLEQILPPNIEELLRERLESHDDPDV